MYYQVLIETSEKVGKSGTNKEYFELDKTDLTEIEERIVKPFLRKEDFQFDGYFLKNSEIRRITIKETQKTTQELSKYENDNMPDGIIMFVSPSDIVGYDRHTKDITPLARKLK
jgi:fumarylacetoacetate (FAA) hydrolase family protein